MAKMEDKDIWYKLYYITVSKDEFELQYLPAVKRGPNGGRFKQVLL
jgi:hypothetical protein